MTSPSAILLSSPGAEQAARHAVHDPGPVDRTSRTFHYLPLEVIRRSIRSVEGEIIA
jgi:hypothetical protein